MGLSEKALAIIEVELQRSADEWPPETPTRRCSPQQARTDICIGFRDYRHACASKADRSAPEESKKLDVVRKLAEKLRKSLGDLAPSTHSELFLWWDIEEGRPSNVPDPQSLAAGIEWLKTRADSAVKNRNDYRMCGSKDPAFDTLLSQLHSVWQRLFPGQKEFSTSGSRPDYGCERYKGPLLDFAVNLLDAEGVGYKSREALGDRLNKIIQAPLTDPRSL